MSPRHFAPLRVILHVGQHKTGSKALQSALYANREWLRDRGFAYPVASHGQRPLRPYEMNHHRLFSVARTATADSSGMAPDRDLLAMLRAMVEPVAATGHTAILSAEDFFDMHTAHEDGFVAERVAAGAALLARAIADMAATVSVVVYLRRQDHLLAAHYAQFIKGSNTNDLAFDAFAERFAPRLDADSLLGHWEQAFGRDAMRVIPYEPAVMPGGIVPSFFAHVLQTDPPPVTTPFPDDLEAFNITPSRDWLDFMRLLNRRSSRGLPVLPREVVLEAAFHDRDRKPAGIAAWLSPSARADLLARHERGNRRIAERYGLGSTLFAERDPDPGDAWTPPPPLTRAGFDALEARVRSRMPAGQRKGWFRIRRERMTDSVDLGDILRG